MPKSADAFRTISEVADWLETPAHVLRFWESKFSQVKPVKRAGGRRYYRPADMKLLGGIKKLLHDDGMTIKGVQKVLRDHGVAYVSDMSQPLGDAADDVPVDHREPEPPVSKPAILRPVTPADPAPIEDTVPASQPDPKDTAKEAPRAVEPAPPLPFVPDPEPEPVQNTAPEVETSTAAKQDPEPAAPVSAQPPEPEPQEKLNFPETAPPPPLPSFRQRRQQEDDPPASLTGATEEKKEVEETDSGSPMIPEPVLPPRVIAVPDDPPDDIAADPGVLSRIARLPHPLTLAQAARLKELVKQLRSGAAAGHETET